MQARLQTELKKQKLKEVISDQNPSKWGSRLRTEKMVFDRNLGHFVKRKLSSEHFQPAA